MEVMSPLCACFSSTRLTCMQRTSNAPSLLLTMAAMPTTLRCAVRLLLWPHPLLCRHSNALMGAAEGGHESTVRLLLEYLADVNAVGE